MHISNIVTHRALGWVGHETLMSNTIRQQLESSLLLSALCTLPHSLTPPLGAVVLVGMRLIWQLLPSVCPSACMSVRASESECFYFIALALLPESFLGQVTVRLFPF